MFISSEFVIIIMICIFFLHKVIRFSKEEMLSLRKPSKILSSMSDMLEMVSLSTLDPVCFEKLDPDDVRHFIFIILYVNKYLLFRFYGFGTTVKIVITTTKIWEVEVEVEAEVVA